MSILGDFIASLLGDLAKPRPKRTSKEVDKELADAFQSLVSTYQQLPEDEKDKADRFAQEQFRNLSPLLGKLVPALQPLLQSAPHHIFTHHRVIITYSIHNPEKNSPLAIDTQLSNMLNANPNCDLAQYQTSLGIRIIRIERKDTPPPPTDGVIIGGK